MKYLYGILFGLSCVFAMNSTEWQNWSAQQNQDVLTKKMSNSPLATQSFEWDQYWIFSSQSQSWKEGQANYFGFPFQQSVAIGIGDTLSPKTRLRFNYNYERRGWSQDDFLFYNAGEIQNHSASQHLFSGLWGYQKWAFEAGVQNGSRLNYYGALWTPFTGINALVNWDHILWQGVVMGPGFREDSLKKNKGMQYFPIIKIAGIDSKINSYEYLQNLYGRYVFSENMWYGDHQAYQIRLNVDPSRFGSLTLGVSEVAGKWQWGGSLDLAFISLGYHDPMERIRGSIWSSDFSFRIHFGLEGFKNKSVQRPGATLPLLPEETNLSKEKK